jgi:hypothetical protein
VCVFVCVCVRGRGKKREGRVGGGRRRGGGRVREDDKANMSKMSATGKPVGNFLYYSFFS